MNKPIECIFNDIPCVANRSEPCVPIGIVVHSTGANNKNLKRYVQPSKTDPNYDEIISVIGLNKNNNSWNRKSSKKSAHYVGGINAEGKFMFAHCVPEDLCSWTIGKGKNGSYNYEPTAHIQIEICEDNLSDFNYFTEMYMELVELCADICARHNFKVSSVVSHKEAHKLGYGSNHKDIDHWLEKFGVTMDILRKDIQECIYDKEFVKFIATLNKNGEKVTVEGSYRIV